MTLELASVTKRFALKGGVAALLRGRSRPCVTALDEVSFTCGRGEILGVVGPNGAGKTTLSKLITNLILPDAGQIRIDGQPLGTAAQGRRLVGYVSCDERSFFWRLTGRQNLRFFLALHDRKDEGPARELARYFEMDGALDRLFGQYSAGMRKRLAIIRGLMADPRVVVFDEATNALDPVTVARLKSLVRERYADRTVLWTTHRLEEINQLCTGVLLLREGRLAFRGSIEALRQRYRRAVRRVALSIRGEETTLSRLVREYFETAEVGVGEGLFVVTVNDNGNGDLMGRVRGLLAAARAELVRFEQVDARMDEIYVAMLNEGTAP